MLRTIAVAVAMLMVLCAGVAGAAVQQLRLLMVKVAPVSNRLDLVTVSGDGRVQRSLLAGHPGLRRGLRDFGTPSWSPDGRLVAFASRRQVWLLGSDGRGPRPVPGTRGGFSPILSPDGHTLAFSRSKVERDPKNRQKPFESAAVWVVDLQTGAQRRITELRNGLEQFPSSYSPDGSSLLVTRLDPLRSYEYELVTIRFDGRTSSLLVGRGAFGRYSPDGSQVVFMRYGLGPANAAYDLYTVDSRGDRLRRLTDTPKVEEIDPDWDPSGRRVVYSSVRLGPRNRIASAAIWEVNRDGSCASPRLSEPGFWLFGPSFQPGPGREAGPLSC